jgi:hypothetical protein
VDEPQKQCAKWKKSLPKSHTFLSHLYEVNRIGRFLERRLVAAKDQGRRNGEWALNASVAAFGVMRWSGARKRGSVPLRWLYWRPLTFSLKWLILCCVNFTSLKKKKWESSRRAERDQESPHRALLFTSWSLGAGGMAQVGEHLPSKFKYWKVNPVPQEKKERKRQSLSLSQVKSPLDHK